MKWKLALVALAVLAVLTDVGCRKKSHHTATANRQSDGIVAELTGDPDDEVDDQTEDMVYDAVQQGDHDQPLDF